VPFCQAVSQAFRAVLIVAMGRELASVAIAAVAALTPVTPVPF
jgi:hypothetical protein